MANILTATTLLREDDLFRGWKNEQLRQVVLAKDYFYQLRTELIYLEVLSSLTI